MSDSNTENAEAQREAADREKADALEVVIRASWPAVNRSAFMTIADIESDAVALAQIDGAVDDIRSQEGARIYAAVATVCALRRELLERRQT